MSSSECRKHYNRSKVGKTNGIQSNVNQSKDVVLFSDWDLIKVAQNINGQIFLLCTFLHLIGALFYCGVKVTESSGIDKDLNVPISAHRFCVDKVDSDPYFLLPKYLCSPK